MTAMMYYVDLDCRMSGSCQDENDVKFLFSKIFTGIHHAIVLECGSDAICQRKIAVSFPHSYAGSHGSVIRVFSTSNDILERTLRHPSLHRFVTGLNTCVQQIPKVHGFQSLSRDRSLDKRSPSAKRRAQARSEKIGKKLFSSHHCDQNKRGLVFQIEVQSQSNKERFLLQVNVREFESDDIGGNFGAYGLSKSPNAVIPCF